MKGDFSRWTFDPGKLYSRVLSQQGRVWLDADLNEGLELQLQHARRLAADLIGPHAGPGTGFEIDATAPPSGDFLILAGSYYVEGVPCRNVPPPPAGGGTPAPGTRYSAQPFLPHPDAIGAGSAIAYLDVWERFVTYIEDEDRTPQELHQSIREVALGGPDTAARTQIVWQVKLLPVPGGAAPLDNTDASYQRFIDQLKNVGAIRTLEKGPHPYGLVKMRARKPSSADLPCATNPESRYRGPENQLYRVEIHDGGGFPAPAAGPRPTFKWSRENGSVIFPIESLEGKTLTLDSVGRDERLGLKQGDLVEVVDDDYILSGRAEPLLTVVSVDQETLVVELDGAPAPQVGTDLTKHPVLRRWEGFGPVSLNPDPETDGYLALEQGVEVHFSNGEYHTGDYWMAPARTATGDVEWPGPTAAPVEIPPQGIRHAYAPLAVINLPAVGGNVGVTSSMRRQIAKVWV